MGTTKTTAAPRARARFYRKSFREKFSHLTRRYVCYHFGGREKLRLQHTTQKRNNQRKTHKWKKNVDAFACLFSFIAFLVCVLRLVRTTSFNNRFWANFKRNLFNISTSICHQRFFPYPCWRKKKSRQVCICLIRATLKRHWNIAMLCPLHEAK